MATELRKITLLTARKFLFSEYGREFVAYLREFSPQVKGDTSDAIILSAGRNQGWRECLENMESLTTQEIARPLELENPGLQ